MRAQRRARLLITALLGTIMYVETAKMSKGVFLRLYGVFLPLSIFCILVGAGWGTHIILLGRGVSVGSMLAIVVGLLFFFLGLIASQLSAIRMGLNDDSDKDLTL